MVRLLAFLLALLFTIVSYGHSVNQPPTTPEPVTHDNHNSRTAAAVIITGILVYYLTKKEKVDIKIKSQPGDDR